GRRRNPSGFGTSGAVAGMTAQRRHGPLDESISRGVRQARQSWLAFWRWSRRPTGAGVSPAARGSGLFVLEEPVDRPVAEDIVRDGTDGPHARWAHFHLREMDFERLGRVKVPTAVDAHESLSGRPTLEIPHRTILSRRRRFSHQPGDAYGPARHRHLVCGRAAPPELTDFTTGQVVDRRRAGTA